MIVYNLLCVLMVGLLTCKSTSCEQTFKNIPVLLRHIKFHHPSESYSCVFSGCNKTLNSVPALQNHSLQCDKADSFTKSTYQKCLKKKTDRHSTSKPFFRY